MAAFIKTLGDCDDFIEQRRTYLSTPSEVHLHLQHLRGKGLHEKSFYVFPKLFAPTEGGNRISFGSRLCLFGKGVQIQMLYNISKLHSFLSLVMNPKAVNYLSVPYIF